MKNITKILRIAGFERFFQKHERHLMSADKQNVKSALELVSIHRSHRHFEGTKGFSKDKSVLFHGCIPTSIYYNEEYWKGINTRNMDRNEIDDMHEAFLRTNSKFSYK